MGGPTASSARPPRSDPTLESWVGMVRSGHLKPKEFLAAVADWESAGMCTPDEAADARRAVE